jgi:hypothetical protein
MHSAGRMPALPGTLWFLGARQPTGMSDCHEKDSPPQREEGPGVVGSYRLATTPDPSLPRRGITFTTIGEPKDNEVFAGDERA